MPIDWGTAAATVITGTLILAIGQVVQRWMAEPMLAVRAAIGGVDFAVTYHANVYMNPGPWEDLHIPTETGHRFRLNPATDSDPIRPLIPEQSAQGGQVRPGLE